MIGQIHCWLSYWRRIFCRIWLGGRLGCSTCKLRSWDRVCSEWFWPFVFELLVNLWLPTRFLNDQKWFAIVKFISWCALSHWYLNSIGYRIHCIAGWSLFRRSYLTCWNLKSPGHFELGFDWDSGLFLAWARSNGSWPLDWYLLLNPSQAIAANQDRQCQTWYFFWFKLLLY